jgi:hypothetical protein
LCQRYIDNRVDIGLCSLPGNFSIVDVDRVADGLFLPSKLRFRSPKNLCRHFANKSLGGIALAPDFFSIGAY